MLHFKDSGRVILNRLQNADMSNSGTYARFASDPEIAALQLQFYLDNYDKRFSAAIDSMFEHDLDEAQFSELTIVLTFWDAVAEARGEVMDIYANDLYFALIVNFSASRQPSIEKIRSYSALYAAKSTAKANGHNLDYRDYVINREYEEKFNHEYIKAQVQPHGYNVPFTIEVPVKKLGANNKFTSKLGMVKLCTDNVPAKLSFEADDDHNTYTIPSYMWMNMMKKGVSRFNKVRFSKLEEKNVAEMIDTDVRNIQGILEANDFETLASIEREGSFGFDFDDDDGHIIIDNVREGNLPSLDNRGAEVAGLCWRKVGPRKYKLEHNGFYLVSNNKDAYNVVAPR